MIWNEHYRDVRDGAHAPFGASKYSWINYDEEKALSYYKAFKVNNIITNAIEKYEGYNELSKAEIDEKLSSIGYQRYDIDCPSMKSFGRIRNPFYKATEAKSENGICIYINVYDTEDDDNNIDSLKNTYQYGIVTYMTINLPIIGDFLKIPIETTTKEMYACYGNNKNYKYSYYYVGKSTVTASCKEDGSD